MNLPTRDQPMFSDDEIAETARSVQPHDFDRIAPPALVWNNILAEVEELRQRRALASADRASSLALAWGQRYRPAKDRRPYRGR